MGAGARGPVERRLARGDLVSAPSDLVEPCTDSTSAGEQVLGAIDALCLTDDAVADQGVVGIALGEAHELGVLLQWCGEAVADAKRLERESYVAGGGDQGVLIEEIVGEDRSCFLVRLRSVIACGGAP